MKTTLIILLASLSLHAQTSNIQDVANQFVGKFQPSSTECSFKDAKRGYIKVDKDVKGNRVGLLINLYGEDAQGITIYETDAKTPGYASSKIKYQERVVSHTFASITNTFTLYYKDGSKSPSSRLILAKSATGNRIRYKEYNSEGRLTDECVLYRIQ